MKPRRAWKMLVAGVLALSAFHGAAFAGDATALSLISEGNKYVGEPAKDKVVEIYSDKSIGSMTPNIWYVVYYDTDATFKATQVKFGAGQKMDVKRPMRMIEMASNDSKTLDRKKMKVDSDRALKTALAEPLFQNLKLKASQMWLQHGDESPVVWKIRIWAAKLKNPNDDTDVGDVYISAEDGKVVRRDLHIERVN